MPPTAADTTALAAHFATYGAAGERARALLGDLGVPDAAPPSGWPRSRLTMPGAPLELRFAESSTGLRYTVEVGPPGLEPERRVSRIAAFLRRRGATLSPSGLATVTRLQACGRLTFGAWLGVNHHANGDTFKLYAEVPPEARDAADAWATSLLGAPHGAAGPPPRVELVGVHAGSEWVEVYYGATDQLRTAIPALARRAGLGAESDGVLSAIDSLGAFPPRAKLPGRDVGFSYAVSPDGGRTAFTVLFVALALYGDDGATAERLLDVCARSNRVMPGYQAFVRQLPAAPPGTTHHGMVGLTSQPGAAEPLLSIGVAAPWSQ